MHHIARAPRALPGPTIASRPVANLTNRGTVVKRACAGLTLVEIVLSLGILVLIFAGFGAEEVMDGLLDQARPCAAN